MEHTTPKPNTSTASPDLARVDSTQNLSSQAYLGPLQLPPGVPGKPYVISAQDGEIIYIPLSMSATRLLITGKESEKAFAVVSSGGSQSAPIGFHYHREAHDVFLCLSGSINVWAGETCRTMTSGDFASVPPGTIHQYQILGPHSEFTGLIVPGGWEEFFRFLGEPYAGPMWPMEDDRDVFEVLIPKLRQAAEKFDMVPLPQHPQSGPQDWDGSECELPGSAEPYFLKNASGPAYEVGGTVCRPLITTKESGGKFAIGSIEAAAQHHQHSIFAEHGRYVRFDAVHHAFQIVEGGIEFQLEATAPSKLVAGDVLYVPKGTAFRFQTVSRASKMYAFASGGGLVEVLCKLGQSHGPPILPERAQACDISALEALQSQFGFSIC